MPAIEKSNTVDIKLKFITMNARKILLRNGIVSRQL